MKVQFATKTDIGLNRSHNEDQFYIHPEKLCCFVIDGLGPYAGNLAVEALSKFFSHTHKHMQATDNNYKYPSEDKIAQAIQYTNSYLYNAALQDKQKTGTGATIAGAIFHKERAHIAHVGDCRIYRIRHNQIEAITEDHSLLNSLLKFRPLTPEEIKNFPYQNVIIRSVGMQVSVDIDIKTISTKENDTFLFCSDGLHKIVPDTEIHEIVIKHIDTLKTACQLLITAANQHGGEDNATVILARIVSG